MKNHQIKEHCQRLRGKQEGKVRDPEKNTKYQPDRKKGGRGRGKGPPGGRKNASRGGRRNIGWIPYRDSS